MAKCINIPITEEYIDKGKVDIIDFTILGFEIDEDVVNFYYIMQDKEEKEYLIKNSFIMDETDRHIDTLFLNSPAHKYLNINKMEDEDKSVISQMINAIDDDNVYYCSFSKVTISEDYSNVDCVCSQNNNNDLSSITISLPFSIYLKIEIFRNNMLHNVLMRANMDDDDRFNNIEIHKNSRLNYIGCELNESVVVEFFSLAIEDDKKIGIFSCVPLLRNDKIIKSKFVTKEQFGVLYKNPLPVDMSKILLLDWNDGAKKIGLFYIINNIPMLFLLNDSILECPLLNPTSVLF